MSGRSGDADTSRDREATRLRRRSRRLRPLTPTQHDDLRLWKTRAGARQGTRNVWRRLVEYNILARADVSCSGAASNSGGAGAARETELEAASKGAAGELGVLFAVGGARGEDFP